MLRVGFIGLGRVGGLALRLLIEERRDLGIVAIDSADRGDLVKRLGGEIKFYRACSPAEIAEIVEGVDLVATALPSSKAYPVIKELLERGHNIVDVSFIGFDPYIFENTCRKHRSFYIVDAGFAPGFSNLILGHIYDRVGKLDRAAIYVGGIPLKPVPPINYQITWSPDDLIEEYTRPARVVVGGAVKVVDPLEKILEVEIPGLGVFEGFYCDGLRTMIKNIEAEEMYEVTIRHKGHLRAIKILRDLGFLDKKTIKIDGYEVEPRRLTAKLFEEKLKQTIPDQAIIYVDVMRGDTYYRLVARLIGDLDRPATSYYTALIYAKTIMIALDNVIEEGVQPLEKLHHHYHDYLKYLRKHGTSIKIETNI